MCGLAEKIFVGTVLAGGLGIGLSEAEAAEVQKAADETGYLDKVRQAAERPAQKREYGRPPRYRRK